MRNVLVSMMGTCDGTIFGPHGAIYVLSMTSSTILMRQCAWASPRPPDICLDFWTSAYQAIDD